MLQFLPSPIVGVVMMILLVINTVFWAIPVYVAVIFKLITWGSWRDVASRAAAAFAQNWATVNAWMVGVFLRIKWEIRIDVPLDPNAQYLVSANHQSWNDIVVLMKAFGRKAPFFKFFIKQELIWVPVLGLAWWGLDYPFMKRHTKEQIERNPSLRGQDLDTTRKACAKFRNQPALILNFLEGTRFTAAKHAAQRSPFRHLLKPKAGGFAFTLSALGDRLNCLLDVTIVYPEGAKGIWAFLSGRVQHIIVEIQQLQIPPDLFVGDYEGDEVFRARFQAWIAGQWERKDQRIGELLAQAKAP